MQILIAFIAAASFYLIPLLVGRLVMQVTRQKSTAFWPLTYFTIGALTMFGYMLIFSLFGHIFSVIPSTWFLQAITRILVTIVVIGNLMTLPRIKIGISKQTILVSIFLLLLAVAGFSIWKYDSPYPYVLNWDIFHHQTLVNNLMQGKISAIPSQVTDSFGFDAYSTLFHVLVAIPQLTLQPDILGFWWFVEFFHFVTTIAVSYVLTVVVSKNKLVAILSAITATFVYESYIVYSSLFLVPQTIGAVVTIALLAYIFDRKIQQASISVSILALTLVVISLLHALIGIAAIAITSTMILMYRYKIFAKKIIFTLITITLPIIVFFVLFLLSQTLSLDMLNSGEAASFVYTIDELIEYARVFYGHAFFLLIPIGVILILSDTNIELKAIVFLGLITITVAVTPLPYVLKFYVLGRYFMHAVIAVSLGFLIQKLSLPLYRFAALTTILGMFAGLLVLNTRYWKDSITHQNQSTLLTKDEIAAAQFLQDSYAEQNVLLVSDPATQQVLEPLSGVNSAGGAYMKKSNRKLLNAFIFASDKQTARDALFTIIDPLNPQADTVLVAFSGKYFSWSAYSEKDQLDYSKNIWKPEQLTYGDYDKIEKFTQEFDFPVVYQNNSMVIVAVSKEQI
ncbi:hypothetical protein C4579_01095 [Candidatus Microgenomates bacterium]|nr:MAG: hypothetical protein C4579_01095 [Candidatus Microgenomates bacterium]